MIIQPYQPFDPDETKDFLENSSFENYTDFIEDITLVFLRFFNRRFLNDGPQIITGYLFSFKKSCLPEFTSDGLFTEIYQIDGLR